MSDKYIAISSVDTIEHFGVKGMKWGVRSRYALNRFKTRRTYKKALRDAKIKYKQNRPNFGMRALRNSSAASLALGLVSKNPDLLKYGISGSLGALAINKITGTANARRTYREEKQDIKDSYRDYKEHLRSEHRKALEE